MKYLFEDINEDGTELELSQNGGQIDLNIIGTSTECIYLSIEEADNFTEALEKVIKKAKKYQEENPEPKN